MFRLLLLISSLLFISTSSFSACDTTIDGVCVESMELMQYDGIGSEPATSQIGNARQYFDPISGKLKCSEDGNSYVDCVGGGTSSINWPDIGGLSTALMLDQAVYGPQTISGGVPLMTTAVDTYGSGDQLVNL